MQKMVALTLVGEPFTPVHRPCFAHFAALPSVLGKILLTSQHLVNDPSHQISVFREERVVLNLQRVCKANAVFLATATSGRVGV